MNINASSSDYPRSHAWQGQWLGGISLAILILFTWLPYSYELMVSWFWIAIWQLGFLLLGVWAIWMLRQFQLPFKPLGYGLDWSIGLIAIALLLSTLFSQFRQLAFWNVSLVAGYVIFIYILRNCLGNSKLTLSRLWMGVCSIGVVTSVISFVAWYPEWSKGAPRNQFPMGHPNFVAGYILLILPLTIALALSRKGWQRIAGLASSILLATVLYTTSSRGGFLGLLALGLITMVFFMLQGREKQRWRRFVGCSIMLGVVALILLSNSRVRQIVQVVSPNTNSPSVQLKVDSESRDRIFMWQSSANILKDKPIFGVGPGNMARVYNLYRPIEVGTGAAHVQQLHNTYLQILGELGLLGFSAFLFSIGCLSVLWFKLYRKLTDARDRYLLYGIGGSLLAYGVSGLSDYQLENISLSSTIVVLIVMLVALADKNQIGQLNNLQNSQRRWLSLGGMTVLVSMLLLWLPVTLAMQFTWESDRNFKAGNLEKAYDRLTVAADLVSWDPVYNLLAGFQLIKVREGIKNTKLSQELSQMSLQHFKEAVKAAPYDAFFNHNLGLLFHEQNDSKQAEVYLSRATQLLPRLGYDTYYLLGLEYLKQQETDRAINALALTGLLQPEFLTLNLWNQLPLSNLKRFVVEKTLTFLEILLNEIPSTSLDYNGVYENIAILRWWYQKNLYNLDLNRLQPVSQALLLAENSSPEALEILNKNIQLIPNNQAFLLLRAWIAPQQYLKSYLELSTHITLEEKNRIKEHILTTRDLKKWLSSLQQKSEIDYRNALTLAYRNLNANKVAFILVPKEAYINSLIQTLSLFPDYPQVLPPLDRLINQIQTEQLNLPHPTRDRFQLETKIDF